jgi:hypothetical protein
MVHVNSIMFSLVLGLILKKHSSFLKEIQFVSHKQTRSYEQNF